MQHQPGTCRGGRTCKEHETCLNAESASAMCACAVYQSLLFDLGGLRGPANPPITKGPPELRLGAAIGMGTPFAFMPATGAPLALKSVDPRRWS